MDANILSVRERHNMGKGVARKLRREGRAPAIAYTEGNTPLHFDLPQMELLKILRKLGKNALLTLQFEGGETPDTLVMLRDLQREPIKRSIMHADFMLVSLDKPVEVSVKLSYEGRPIGMVNGGIADVQRRHITVECLPNNIPTQISVDVTGLGMNQALHVGDVTLPEGVELADDAKFTLVTISAPKGMEDVVAEGEEEAEA